MENLCNFCVTACASVSLLIRFYNTDSLKWKSKNTLDRFKTKVTKQQLTFTTENLPQSVTTPLNRFHGTTKEL